MNGGVARTHTGLVWCFYVCGGALWPPHNDEGKKLQSSGFPLLLFTLESDTVHFHYKIPALCPVPSEAFYVSLVFPSRFTWYVPASVWMAWEERPPKCRELAEEKAEKEVSRIWFDTKKVIYIWYLIHILCVIGLVCWVQGPVIIYWVLKMDRRALLLYWMLQNY